MNKRRSLKPMTILVKLFYYNAIIMSILYPLPNDQTSDPDQAWCLMSIIFCTSGFDLESRSK